MDKTWKVRICLGDGTEITKNFRGEQSLDKALVWVAIVKNAIKSLGESQLIYISIGDEDEV